VALLLPLPWGKTVGYWQGGRRWSLAEEMLSGTGGQQGVRVRRSGRGQGRTRSRTSKQSRSCVRWLPGRGFPVRENGGGSNAARRVAASVAMLRGSAAPAVVAASPMGCCAGVSGAGCSGCRGIVAMVGAAGAAAPRLGGSRAGQGSSDAGFTGGRVAEGPPPPPPPPPPKVASRRTVGAAAVAAMRLLLRRPAGR
jgi:hypothetical protein